jgi:ABC-type branched-subunit amino acid transport system ATPase component
LIGANGAGKTTLLMTICGRPRARSGQILFEGDDITNIPMHDLVDRGIAHVPEGRHIFPRMTVLENLQMGARAGNPKNFSNDLDFVPTRSCAAEAGSPAAVQTRAAARCCAGRWRPTASARAATTAC